MAQAAAVSRGIEDVLGRVRIATRQAAKDVTLWPLVLAGPGEEGELWPLAEALEDGFVGVEAPDAGGCARVESRAPAPVWIAEGEPLGAAGVAAESLIVQAHGQGRVRVHGAGASGCPRCCAALARSFRPVEGQVGFVVAVHERALGLELVFPAGALARRLRERLLAWAPFLLAEQDEAAGRGFDSPEALLAALAAGERALGVEGVRASVLVAGRQGCTRLHLGPSM